MNRIDIHHHIAAPAYREAITELHSENPLTHMWTVEKSLEAMEKGGVETSISSMPFEFTRFPAQRAAQLARGANDFAKDLEVKHAGRFGTFAMLPLPHVEETLREIAYVYDELGVDGVCLQTSYGATWLGYEEFAPVFEELNRRHAVVYTHPLECTACPCSVRNVQPMLIEFGTDTTRTIASLLTARAAERYPNISYIFSHGGGVLTSVAERFLVQMVRIPPMVGKLTREQVERDLRGFFYDTAQITNSVTLKALLDLVPASQVLFGSDWPFRTPQETAAGYAGMFDPAVERKIDRDNALALLRNLSRRG